MYNNNSGYGNQGGYGGGGYGNQQGGGFGRQQQGGYGNQQQQQPFSNQGGYGQQPFVNNNNNNNNDYQNNYNNNNNNNNNNNYGGGNSGGNDPEDVSTNSDYKTTTSNIQQIQSSVQQLKKLVDQLGTPKDTLEVREKIRSCVENTAHFIQAESSKVKNLTTLSNRTRYPRNKLLYQKLVKEYNNSLQQFKDIAQVATSKEKTTPLPQANPNDIISQNNSNPFAGRGKNNNNNNYNNNQYQQQYYDEKEDETQSLMESSRRQQLQQVESEREYQNAIIQERDEGIRQIEQSIVEINEIFMDLSTLVSEQGVMLDTIEGSIRQTEINTKEGVGQLRKAAEHQKSSRTKMCWLALILLIVAAVLGVILFFTLRK